MAEEDFPLALEIVGKADLALGGHGLEPGSLVTDTGHGIILLLILVLNVVVCVHNFILLIIDN